MSAGFEEEERALSFAPGNLVCLSSRKNIANLHSTHDGNHCIVACGQELYTLLRCPAQLLMKYIPVVNFSSHLWTF